MVICASNLGKWHIGKCQYKVPGMKKELGDNDIKASPPVPALPSLETGFLGDTPE
jgi:hypothetical protein